jgi:aspartate racemase
MGIRTNREVIGVVGGMGPLAGARLVELITRLTPALCDQDHRDVLLVSTPSRISDRTEFLLGHCDENPAAAVADCVQLLACSGATCVGIACNSAHAPPIWDAMTDILARRECDVEVLHLIEEACREVGARVPPGSKVGVLGTTGSIRSDVYGQVLRAAGFEVLYLGDLRQSEVHEAIYNELDGLKSGARVSERVRVLVKQAARELIGRGARCVVLGCTELPEALPLDSLGGVPVIDPAVVMARRLVLRSAGRGASPASRRDSVGTAAMVLRQPGSRLGLR